MVATISQEMFYFKYNWARLCENVCYGICEQQRRRSACTFAQSDQHLCFRCSDSVTCIFALSKVSRFYLASVAAQAGLNVTWSQTLEETFSLDEAKLLKAAL